MSTRSTRIERFFDPEEVRQLKKDADRDLSGRFRVGLDPVDQRRFDNGVVYVRYRFST